MPWRLIPAYILIYLCLNGFQTLETIFLKSRRLKYGKTLARKEYGFSIAISNSL